MRDSIRTLILAALLFILPALYIPQAKTTVHLIGDSTMADKQPLAFPETGWGTPFRSFFDEGVIVENHARNGRSTRTFIEEGRWQAVAAALKKGDYLFIQFGHNDESVEKNDRYTSPADYKTNLKRFVTECRARGAFPVLLTPVSRRSFDGQGMIRETHKEYSALAREVAAETVAPLIDLDELSRALFQEFGEEKSKLLFLHLAPGEHPNYPEGKVDNTHFNELGARKTAQLVLQEIVRLELGLTERIVNFKPVK